MLEDLRKASVSPVFKKGKEEPENYRLVSLNSVTGKVLEACGGKEGYQEQSTHIHQGEITTDQPDSLQ